MRGSARLAGEELQFVVIDNASDDDAVARTDLTEDDVVVRNPVNAGYGVAAAQGIARADSPWILLVNPDVVVEQAFIGALLGTVDRSGPDVATLVPEMRFVARPDVVNCRGLTVDEIGVPAEVDAGTRVVASPTPSVAVLGGSSGCCLLRSDPVHRLGGPEPMFFAYLEDVDLALRLSCAGYQTVFVPDAIALHEGSASTGAQSPLKVHLVARNRRLLFRLHGPRGLRASALRTLVDVAHGAYSSLATPVAPWAGRLEALRTRRYASFLRRARKRWEPCRVRVMRPPRASLLATLRRKRAVVADDG